MKKKSLSSIPTSFYFLVTLLVFMLLAAGCQRQSKGFVLPEGDIEKGKLLFTQLNCQSCHSIGEIKWTGDESDPNVPLGGEVTHIKTYGELVTSIIKPDHKISKSFLDNVTDEHDKSKMFIYNDYLTVQQLIDIVAFLQSQYEIETPEIYPHYY